MTILRSLLLTLALLSVGLPQAADAQSVDPEVLQSEPDQATTTLEDILRRQEGLSSDDTEARREIVGSGIEPAQNTDTTLGTLGGSSDSDLWRAFRFDERDITTQARGPATNVIMQGGGQWWLDLRQGPVMTYGGYLLLGTIGLLALFYLLKGRIRIDGDKTGRTITRFTGIERFGHWLLAGSFIILALTGILSLMGRTFLIPLLGHEAFATMAQVSKWLHNNVSWAFMIALVLVFVMWVVHNIPDRTDINWILKGGGLLIKGHPPAKKFNAGQKMIFWVVILFGASVSASGLALLFPFQITLFEPTFALLNSWGVPSMIGMEAFPTGMEPQEEMQYAQLWHAIISFVMMAVILAHIYIGSVGMEGAFDAMGNGEVEEQWAKEHHSIWAEEEIAKRNVSPKTSGSGTSATPAE
ncbi:Formate dehydrogenase, nitrate-inducible, cytochrome b556(Fdn) subunit [Roseivivax sp. THAF40]|uniref:formate dehydrogenase subunit gamma n=1 Tax=unclassified Roseivivax TaxID=2639302 RepID=UPI00126957CB|nr:MULTISPECIES: formate dehydrogenase subunit gamma [unclassified Roseivivax]QFS83959.1 Formate dehydrogenase, nitrate-inducible, cytochrome b556(Fdn) subunit [Roseivivax sp. THAF197b]QFT47791.1 Formate dehydrogenase, nitrate-inducible, cytochrome b556(Fdn) subunit [Roseivivax sp. THAF40]